ncbi:hypothetical protein SAMN05192534_105120 [Alteribacillus persepolensis]|uniref:Gas vesicle protein n=1 Tax=Alteribacillus persepolensis TaxID=568899 RepID=A0A1G8CBD3_9BACI|nr:hypothetical protein [Alteribacillus persepolensis]SDH42543.1 hypothetical protein SAMN05192534_105120 [Alteribacillus persepolensis]
MAKQEAPRSRLGMKIGIAVGSISALVLIGNRQSRQRIVSGTKQTASAINEASKFVAENREEIIGQVKSASNQLADLLKSANEDIQQITQRANHLKDTTLSVKETTQKTAEELKDLKDKERTEENVEADVTLAENVEKFPSKHQHASKEI